MERPPHDAALVSVDHRWLDDAGDTVAVLGKRPDGFHLCFPGLADFLISDDGLLVRAWSESRTTLETVRHLLLDQVMPRVMAHMGKLVLHASAVSTGGSTVAFLGTTGSGKSTLAAKLSLHGHPLVSDDALILRAEDDAVYAEPTYSSLRLWPDAIEQLYKKPPTTAPMAHYSRKRRVIGPGTTMEAAKARLAALYVLAPGTPQSGVPATISEKSQADACIAILKNTFQLDVTNKVRVRALFTSAADVAERLPVYELLYRRDYSCVPQVRSILLEHASRIAG
jgi:hypothetical protein